ncbi:14080_t:CDS:2, partial [Entrophospora sp. SA101]
TKNFQLVTFSLERVGGGEEGACQFGAKLEGSKDDVWEMIKILENNRKENDGLKNDPTGIFLKCYAFGRIIYDPSNILPTFQNLAKKRWEAGPPALEDKDRWRPRYEIADLLRDLEDIDYVQNEATAHFLLVKLVERLVRIQERLWNRWPEKLKRCVEGWETWDDSGGKLAKKVLNSNVKWNERLMCAKDLAKYVLGPIGGIMPTEWNMEWEELQESYNPFTIPNIIPKLE